MTIRSLTIAAALITTVAVASTVTTYTVRKGDSLSKIAHRFGVSEETLRSANRLQTANHLQKGQVLQIPTGATQAQCKVEIPPSWVSLGTPNNTCSLPTIVLTPAASDPLVATITNIAQPAKAASKILKAKKPTTVASNNPILKQAMGYRGVRYRWGGTSRSSGVDCSGFTTSVFRSQGIKLPRTALEQSHVGDAVGKASLQPGDLVFFRTNRSVRVNHVGIYVGEGKFIHAATRAGRVMVSSLSDAYYLRTYASARRIADFNVAARASRILQDANLL